MNDLPLQAVKKFEGEFYQFIDRKYPQIPLAIKNSGQFTDEIETQLKDAVEEFKVEFQV